MTIGELRKELAKYPDATEVVAGVDDGWLDVLGVYANDTLVKDIQGKPKSIVVILA